MVSKRILFLISACVHGLLALSISQYAPRFKQKASHNFPITFLSFSKETKEQSLISAPSQKAKHCKIENILTSENTSPIVKTYAHSTSIPSATYNPAPAYPSIAKNNGEEADFSVTISVSPTGSVEHLAIITIKGKKELFEEELYTTLITWKFSPSGKKVSFQIPISFRLDE